MSVETGKRGVRTRRAAAAGWSISIAATVASTYALDAVATVCGIGLVAWGALSGLDLWAAVGFLGLSYLAWGLGLRAAVAANWALLSQTGTSTNLPSKIAHDLTARTSRSVRARRLAAAVGYVGTELVKELPYYVGAVGTSLLSDAVSANEAVVFLAGANLGAAGYEGLLALATRTLLRRRTKSLEPESFGTESLVARP